MSASSSKKQHSIKLPERRLPGQVTEPGLGRGKKDCTVCQPKK